jgi:RHS repeat-associated protein
MPTTNYIWDDENILAETDENNIVQTLYTNEPQQYGNLISSRLPISGTPTSFYHNFDAIGSTRQLTNGAGTVTDSVIYDAWGNVTNRTGTTPVGLLWVGMLGYYFDSETDTLYVRARMYQAGIARWTTRDPLEFIDGVDLFVYSANSPIVTGDPGRKLCRQLVFTVVGDGCAPLDRAGHLEQCKINTFGPGMFQYG